MLVLFLPLSRNMENQSQPTWRPRHNPWAIALTVTLATFMEILDTSIANVAVPHIAGGLAASVDEGTWVLTSYLVSNAVVLPLSGWLASRFGRKRFYMSCVALFTISSLLCGLAPTLGTLLLFRVLQGVGGGGLQPSEQAILADTFPVDMRAMAFAVYGMAVVVAPAVGPALGGWITDNYSWRWIFLINFPVGIASLLLTSRLVEDPPHLRQKKNAGVGVDYIGFALVALGFGFLQVVLDKGQQKDWFGDPYIVAFSVITIVALIALLVWELRHRDPIVDLRLLKDRTFLAANILMFALGFALYGSTVLIPLFGQTLLGYTAQQAGLLITPSAITLILLMPVVGFLVSKIDARLLITFGFVVLFVALMRMTRFDLDVDFRTVMWARVLQGAGLAFLFIPINVSAFAQLPPDRSSAGSGIINLSRNIGGSVGISFVTTFLARRAQFHQHVLASHVTAFDGSYRAMLEGASKALKAGGTHALQAPTQAVGLLYETLVRQSTMLAYIDNFWAFAMASLAVVPLVFLIKRAPKGARAPVH
jgi:DHA2 family multidrug resistance protein